MSHMRRRLTAVVGSVAACALLSGCVGSGDDEPSATHGTRHPRTSPTDVASSDSPPTSSPTVSTSSSPTTASALRFSPKSGGKHSDDCQRLVPGDDPAEFLYYPVLVKAMSDVDLDTIATDHTQGVVDAASWVAPAGSTPETGTFKGWPPASIVTHDSNLHWSERVRAPGAALDPSVGWYNVFLRLQVDPTPGDSAVNGIVFTYHDAGGSHTATWVAHTTFSMDC